MPDNDLSRRSFLGATGVLLGMSLDATVRPDTPSLKETYQNAFLIGTALDFRGRMSSIQVNWKLSNLSSTCSHLRIDEAWAPCWSSRMRHS
jgi:hypothetical protein